MGKLGGVTSNRSISVGLGYWSNGSWSEKAETKERKRVRLETDEEKAQLVKLCIKHFARYSEGRDRYFSYIRGVWEKEM
jgi:hypothetical protein